MADKNVSNSPDLNVPVSDIGKFVQEISEYEEAVRLITYGFIQALKVMPLLDDQRRTDKAS